MKTSYVTIRHIDSSSEAKAELALDDDTLILQRAFRVARQGWAAAAKKIAEAGDDALIMGKFGNAGDSELSC